MEGAQLHEIFQSLGNIQARLGTIEQNQENERINANQHRSDLRIVIQAQSNATADLAAKLQKVIDDVSDMKPLTDDYRENRAQARGAAKLVLIFRVIVVALVGTVGWVVAYLGWTPRH